MKADSRMKLHKYMFNKRGPDIETDGKLTVSCSHTFNANALPESKNVVLSNTET